MKYESISDVYSANTAVRKRFLGLLEGISDDESAVYPEGEKWNIREIVEHLAMVEFGMLRICGKLIESAKESGGLSDGRVSLSADFGAKSKELVDRKVEAPERVQPTGTVSVSEAIERINGTTLGFEGLRQDFERLDLSEPKFPHPYFGDLTAVEWLVLKGGHESRHSDQIERILASTKQ